MYLYRYEWSGVKEGVRGRGGTSGRSCLRGRLRHHNWSEGEREGRRVGWWDGGCGVEGRREGGW